MDEKSLNQRSLNILKELVESYMETGEAVGSKSIASRLESPLSPATIRNVMADLERLELLYSPHTSAGRLPTEKGLKLFVKGLLEVSDLSPILKKQLKTVCLEKGKNLESLLEETTSLLSGLSNCTGLLTAPKSDKTPLKHVDFVHLSHQQGLVILVLEDGSIENRLIDLPVGFTPSMLQEAANYLNYHVQGKTLEQAESLIKDHLDQNRQDLHSLTDDIIKRGLAIWDDIEDKKSLIIKGHANLLGNLSDQQSLEEVKNLFKVLETKESAEDLLKASLKGKGVQIFIGSDNALFSSYNCSVVVSPYENKSGKVIGAIGVVGPNRMNYGKVIPLVDYTAKLISKILSS